MPECKNPECNCKDCTCQDCTCTSKSCKTKGFGFIHGPRCDKSGGPKIVVHR